MQVKIYKEFKSFSKYIDAAEKNEVFSTVKGILTKVRKKGDVALREYTNK